jgi:hypothetical protein
MNLTPEQKKNVLMASVVGILLIVVIVSSVGWGKCKRKMHAMVKAAGGGSAKQSLGGWLDSYKNAVTTVVNTLKGGKVGKKPNGYALLPAAYPAWDAALQTAADQAATAGPQGMAPLAPGYMPLGAQAPLLTDAYGYSNPITTTEDPNMPISDAEKTAGRAASDEYDSAAKAITFQAANGKAGDGTDKVGVPGTDLKEAYGDSLQLVDLDKVMQDANDAMADDPIQAPPKYDGPYDDDAVTITDAYGNAFTDGSQAPVITPQGVMNAATYQPGDYENIGKSRMSGNPLLQGLAGPPGTYIGGGHLGGSRRTLDSEYLGSRRSLNHDEALGAKKGKKGGQSHLNGIIGHIGAVPQRQGASMKDAISHIGAVPQRQGASMKDAISHIGAVPQRTGASMQGARITW